jgi:hypothetical protein
MRCQQPILRFAIPSLILVCLLVSGGAAAHTFEAPIQVQADAAGHFGFMALFAAGPGDAQFAFQNLDGQDNTDVGQIMLDGFCTATITEGEQMLVPVEGNLVDLEQNGTVLIQFGVCPSGEWTTETLILRPGITATYEESWGTLKERYR